MNLNALVLIGTIVFIVGGGVLLGFMLAGHKPFGWIKWEIPRFRRRQRAPWRESSGTRLARVYSRTKRRLWVYWARFARTMHQSSRQIRVRSKLAWRALTRSHAWKKFKQTPVMENKTETIVLLVLFLGVCGLVWLALRKVAVGAVSFGFPAVNWWWTGGFILLAALVAAWRKGYTSGDKLKAGGATLKDVPVGSLFSLFWKLAVVALAIYFAVTLRGPYEKWLTTPNGVVYPESTAAEIITVTRMASKPIKVPSGHRATKIPLDRKNPAYLVIPITRGGQILPAVRIERAPDPDNRSECERDRATRIKVRASEYMLQLAPDETETSVRFAVGSKPIPPKSEDACSGDM